MTVNSDWYMIILGEFFPPWLDELDLADIWFQQGGATPDTSRALMPVLRICLQGCLI